MKRTVTAAIGAVLFLGQGILFGEPRPTELKWIELGGFAQEKAAMTLPSGTYIEGKIVAVERDGLRLRVSRTSDRKAVPKGEQLIPRQDVSVLKVTGRRVLARPLLALGLAATAAAVVVAGTSDLYEGPGVVIRPAVGVAGAVGMGTAGYYIGRRLDRRVTLIKIVDRPAGQ